MKYKIMIVDDEEELRCLLRDFLERLGYEVEEADSVQSAPSVFRSSQPDAAILDYRLCDGNGLDLFPRLKEIDPSVPVVMLTGYGSIDLAVRAIKEGAEQFLTKPIDFPALGIILERLLENRRNRKKQLANQSKQNREKTNPFLGTSAAIRELENKARKLINADSPILIQGETGTGKGVLATWFHRNGPRADEAFVDLNCAGLSREFLETELFGHEKGAFTGAASSKTGLFEVAHRGAIFLDEIGDVSLEVQPKLLKALEEKRFRRMGDVRDRWVDVQLIAATHQNLIQMVQSKQFRDDLYFRISTLPLIIPSLRQRVEDIPIIAQSLLAQLARQHGRSDIHLTKAAERVLQSYHWPGNIRELRNALERAVILSESDALDVSDLNFLVTTGNEQSGEELNLTLAEMERKHIERVLHDTGWHVERAAKRLDVPRSSLYQKLKQFGIAAPQRMQAIE
jgi:DNA-binding NtrC family response regulator